MKSRCRQLHPPPTTHHQHVIAIDGPAGAGKTTVAREVARQLGWAHVDTGAMYRALTWAILREGCDPDDEAALMVVARRTRLRLRAGRDGAFSVFVNGRNVARAIRHSRISRCVSRVARHPRVRHWMLSRQRAMARCQPVVMEGRDIGTVVFPRARWKFFLSATPTERARRRYAELQHQGLRIRRARLLRDMRRRDQSDRRRAVAPLRAAPDAICLDTTRLSIQDVVHRILQRMA